MSIPMPITFLDVPELLDNLPETQVEKEPYKKENRLERLSREQNVISNIKNKDKDTILEVSVKTIFERIISTISGIIEELIGLDEFNIRKVYKIFTEGDRMIYFGIFIVILSILIFMIGITSWFKNWTFNKFKILELDKEYYEPKIYDPPTS